ncbi:MAG: sulfite exporter TauE/SafE family protein [Chloroflexi bacterium]|nr:sulfite exporter TauE/SafE family protein [Chloroflexota bacterium]
MEIVSSLTIAFVTGLISSFGHCLGMCGGIVAIYSARQAALVTVDGSKPGMMMRVGMLAPVHVGRIATYTFLGALVGFAGAMLNAVGGFAGLQGAFSIIVGIVMILIALSLMGVLPSMESVLASATTGIAPMKRMRGRFGQRNLWSTIGLGLLWGFLPCGLVFAMLVVAASAQSVWGGALTMLAFGLGTIPTLLGFGLAANMLSPKLRGRLQFFAALLILLFAIQTILRGLAVANIVPSLIIGPVMLW